LHKRFDEEALHGVEVRDDLLVAAVAVGSDRGELQAVERALASEGLALIPRPGAVVSLGVVLAGEDGEEGIVAELVVVVEVFVSQAEAKDPLFEQFGEGVFNAVGVAMVGETAAELIDEVELDFEFAEEQAAGVGGDGTAVEAAHDLAGTEVLEEQVVRVTLCHGETAPWVGYKAL
jgi:hypothetical protein